MVIIEQDWFAVSVLQATTFKDESVPPPTATRPPPPLKRGEE